MLSESPRRPPLTPAAGLAVLVALPAGADPAPTARPAAADVRAGFEIGGGG